MEDSTFMEDEPGPTTTFDQLGLSEPVLQAVRDLGYEKPTPIQAQAIPAILEGRDVIGASQTGTGKTAAFGMPILTKLGQHESFRCLVLEPTRELAAQVEDQFQIYGKHAGIEVGLLHGGVGYKAQLEKLKGNADVIIATPGRLLDHLGRGNIQFKGLQFLVLDEVDRMLDMGFLPDVRKIVTKCPKSRQTLFFSATMPPAIDSLAKWALENPFEVSIGQRQGVAETVSHAFFPVAYEQRDELIHALLKATDFHSVMVFTRTKAEADKLTSMIKKGGHFKVATMHSDIPQRERTKALQGFREGKFEVIIATDLAARGLDISNVTHVINYRVPENPEDYVHRIGRTGRAEREGDAFTILSGDELEQAEAVERFIGKKIERRKLDDFPYIYTALLDEDSSTNAATLSRMLGRSRRSKPRRRRR